MAKQDVTYEPAYPPLQQNDPKGYERFRLLGGQHVKGFGPAIPSNLPEANKATLRTEFGENGTVYTRAQREKDLEALRTNEPKLILPDVASKERVYISSPKDSVKQMKADMAAAEVPIKWDQQAGLFYTSKAFVEKVPAEWQKYTTQDAFRDRQAEKAIERGLDATVAAAASVEALLQHNLPAYELRGDINNPKDRAWMVKQVEGISALKMPKVLEVAEAKFTTAQKMVDASIKVGETPSEAEMKDLSEARAQLKLLSVKAAELGVSLGAANPYKQALQPEMAAPAVADQSQAINQELGGELETTGQEDSFGLG